MSINPYPVQQRLVQYMDDTFVQPVFEGGVPNPETIVRDGNGNISPYIVARFSDLSRDYRQNSLASARLDNYYSFLDCVIVAPSDRIARSIGGYVIDKMIGAQVEETGELAKVGGGGDFVVLDGRDKPPAFIYVVGFRFTYNFNNQS